MPGWTISLALHASLLIALMLWLVEAPQRAAEPRLISGIERPVTPLEQLPRTDTVLPSERSTIGRGVANPLPNEVVELVAGDVFVGRPIALADLRPAMLPSQVLMAPLGEAPRGLGDIRTDDGRRARVFLHGGSEQSEEAVEAALRWLASHQLPDGGWSFDHRLAEACHGQCAHEGNLPQARAAATGLALLPFLAAGHTQRQGAYRRQVDEGLNFLVSQMRVQPQGGNLTQGAGTMYSHALGTLALCEAHGMTRDRKLARPAQLTLNFIVSAQDAQGGGWRYHPGQPGDTSVTGWQLMALKSGHLGYLQVPPQTIAGAAHFFNQVQRDDGAAYGYLSAEDGTPGTTAVGLLARMYFGWQHDSEPLARGVEYLAELGPSPDALYFNYHANQVLFHYGGPHWERWNPAMRELLISTQARQGHEAGSWHFTDEGHSTVGGRLYCTALAALTLEVYYRYLPLYGPDSVRKSFD